MIRARDLVLFQGDSITDCGRDRQATADNDLNGLGRGYAMMAAAALLAGRPGDSLRFRNLGIGGDRSVDLAARWQEDALSLRPDLISILIGVNDTWHGFSKGTEKRVSVEKYARVYRELLDETRAALPQVRLVLCEPFVLPCGEVAPAWRDDVDRRREVVRELAQAFGAALVEFQAMFDRALDEAPAEYWATDGVHPTVAGHHRLAQTWLRTVAGDRL